MKKTYTKPVAEMIYFDFRQNIVASGGDDWSRPHNNHAWGPSCYKDPHDPNPGPKPPHPGRPW